MSAAVLGKRSRAESEEPAACCVCFDPRDDLQLLGCMHVACADCLQDLRALTGRCVTCLEPCGDAVALGPGPDAKRPAPSEEPADQDVRALTARLAELLAALEGARAQALTWREGLAGLGERLRANNAKVREEVVVLCRDAVCKALPSQRIFTTAPPQSIVFSTPAEDDDDDDGSAVPYVIAFDTPKKRDEAKAEATAAAKAEAEAAQARRRSEIANLRQATLRRLVDALEAHERADAKLLELDREAADAHLAQLDLLKERAAMCCAVASPTLARFLVARLAEQIADRRYATRRPLLVHGSFLCALRPRPSVGGGMAVLRNAVIGRGFIHDEQHFRYMDVFSTTRDKSMRLPRTGMVKPPYLPHDPAGTPRPPEWMAHPPVSIEELLCGDLAVACLQGHVHIAGARTLTEKRTYAVPECTKLRVLPTGELWVAARGGLSRLDPATGVRSRLDAFTPRTPGAHIKDFEVTRTGIVFLWTSSPDALEYGAIVEIRHLDGSLRRTLRRHWLQRLGPVFEDGFYVDRQFFELNTLRTEERSPVQDPERMAMLPNASAHILGVNNVGKIIRRRFKSPPKRHFGRPDEFVFWQKYNSHLRFLHDGQVVFEKHERNLHCASLHEYFRV